MPKLKIKSIPLSDGHVDGGYYVEDLARIEVLGDTCHLHFATVETEMYGADDWRPRRKIRVKLMMPASLRTAIAMQLLAFRENEPQMETGIHDPDEDLVVH